MAGATSLSSCPMPPACRAAGRGGIPRTPASHRVLPPAWPAAAVCWRSPTSSSAPTLAAGSPAPAAWQGTGVAPGHATFVCPASAGLCSHALALSACSSFFFVLLMASFFRRAILCFSAQASQRVRLGTAGSRQSRHSSSSFALSRQFLAALLEASLRSGCSRLEASCSLRSSGVFLTLGGETFLGGLGLGPDVGLGFAGSRRRRLSPGFSRIGVDEGLLAGSYLQLNLSGSGMRRAKVAPTARVCGETCFTQNHVGRHQGGPLSGLSPRGRGNLSAPEA